jgi:ribosome-associated toxin RatA of RatAB toxin-antitoxin module
MLYHVEREVELPAPPGVVFDVVWGFERYPRFVTGVAAVNVLSREASEIHIEITAKLMGIPFRYELACTRDGDRVVRWQRVAGAFARAEGAWTLLGTHDGRARVRYENAVDPGIPAPGFIVKYVLDTSLPRLLTEFRAEVATRAQERAT